MKKPKRDEKRLMWRQYLIVFSSLILVLFGFQNCSEIDFSVADLSRVVSADDAVCDPFSSTEESEVTAQNGLVGQLRYLVMGIHGDTRSELNSRHLDYYMAEALPADGVLFFSQINTPTMSFDMGFKNSKGETLKNPVNMEDLIEYFSMDFQSQLELGLSDVAGQYQLALLSDDGSSMYVSDEDGSWKQLIDNDGTHSTRMVCAMDTVEISEDQLLPIRVQYFQGPRTEIAFQLLWRQVDDGDDLSDPLCGQTGRGTFFTGYENGGESVATQEYLNFMDRGWKVLEPTNFRLPAEVLTNPCVEEVGDLEQ